MLWLGLDTKNTWLGSSKHNVMASNTCFGLHEHNWRCSKYPVNTALKISSGDMFTNSETNAE